MDSRSPVYPPSSYPNFSSFSFPPQQPVTEQTHFEKSLPSFRVELAAAEAAQNYSRRRSSVYRVAGEYYYTQSDPIPFTGSQNLAKFHDLPFPNYNIGGEGLIRDDVKNYNRGVTDGFREVQYTTPPSAKHDFQTFLEPSNTGNTQHSYPDYIPSTQQSSCHGPPPGNSAYSNYFRNSQYSQSAAQDHSGNRSMQGLRIDTLNASPSIPTSSVRASPISQFPIHSTGSHPSFPAFNSTLGNSFRGYGLSPSTSTSLSATTSRGPSRNSNYSPSEISSPTFSPGQSHFEVSRNGGAFNCNPANISPGIESTALDFAKEQERYRYDQENHSRGGRSYQRMQGEEEREEKEQSVSISRLSKPKKNIHDSKKRSTRDEDDYQESTPSPTHHSPSYLQPHTQPDRNQSSSPLSSFGETPSPPPSPTKVKSAKKTKSSTNNTPRSTRLAGLKNVFRPSPVSMLASASETTLHQKNKRAHGGRGDGIEVDWSQMITKKSRGRRVQVASGSKSKENDDEEDDDEEEEEEKDVKGKGKKSFICKVPDCGKQFKRSEHLKRHVRSIHTNDRPYQCKWPECLKKFSRHDNLSQHLRVHRVEGQTDEEFSNLVRKAFGDGEED